MAGDYKSPVTKPNLRISNSQERRIQALMPEYDYCYLGDNSRAYRPFGFNYVTLR
ncbi:MAG: hypothetical protein KIC84_11215 [Dysgonomonas mossii]|uniref:hypothetical protein n=1 Tax=Dysgonomonas mossii TaxID=163665 RepID=UPI0026F36745|nr:hypothetical protein [Dysgonomonas mossii]MBS5907782.1 hypothetical protein [Dysgonomonas mossii]